MKMPFIPGLIKLLLRFSLKIMPKYRSEWALAMMAETRYLTNDFQALMWALGCLTTAMMERIKTMKTGTLRVSKFVLSLEVLCCFIPVTFVYANLIYEVLPLVLDLRDSDIFILLSITIPASLIGPTGIILGLKFLLQGPFRIGNMVKTVLSILAIGAVLAPFWFMRLTLGNITLANSWLVITVVALMPTIAMFHVMYMIRENRAVVQG